MSLQVAEIFFVMKIYTLLATGDMGDGAIMAIKSWPSINAKVFREIKEIILDLEIRGKGEADEEDIEIIQDGFLLSDTLVTDELLTLSESLLHVYINYINAVNSVFVGELFKRTFVSV